MRGFVGRIASGAQLVTAVSMALVAVRFAFVAFTAIMGASIELPMDTGPLPGASAEVSFAPPRTEPTIAGRPTSAPPPTRSLSLMLMISVGEDRSEVFVNGRQLGHSPFVGDFPCKAGEPLKIEVVPKKGPLETFVRPCVGETLRIDQ